MEYIVGKDTVLVIITVESVTGVAIMVVVPSFTSVMTDCVTNEKEGLLQGMDIVTVTVLAGCVTDIMIDWVVVTVLHRLAGRVTAQLDVV